VFQGLKREDLLTVVVEQFLTDTTRFADYVFPATTQLEHLDLLTSWGHEYLSLNQPAVPAQGEAAPNTEFFRRLARKMGYVEPYLYESDEEMVKTLLRSQHPSLGGITYEQLRERGWVRLALPDPFTPYAQGGFPTKSGKCEFYSEALAAEGFDPLPTYVPVGATTKATATARTYPLALLTSKSTLHFNNSSHGSEPRQRQAEGEPLVQVHPEDAAPRKIQDGTRVRIFNDRGSVTLRARVGEGTRPGVVSFPHGFWASLLPGGSSGNALTPDGLSDLGGGGDFLDARVEVESSPA
jgi:anaerobic selenocysteine-containing dehydrogenase